MVEMRLGRIARNYLAGWLLVDVLAVLPLDILYRYSSGCLDCSFAMSIPCDCNDNNAGPGGAEETAQVGLRV